MYLILIILKNIDHVLSTKNYLIVLNCWSNAVLSWGNFSPLISRCIQQNLKYFFLHNIENSEAATLGCAKNDNVTVSERNETNAVESI